MGNITIMIQTDDLDHESLLENLRIAQQEREGITIRTGGGTDHVEVLAIRDDGTS